MSHLRAFSLLQNFKYFWLAFVAIVSSVLLLISVTNVWSGDDPERRKETVRVDQTSDEDKEIITNFELFENLELFMENNIEMIYLLDIFTPDHLI